MNDQAIEILRECQKILIKHSFGNIQFIELAERIALMIQSELEKRNVDKN